MQDDGETVGEVPHERGRVQGERARHDLDDAPITHLPAVAERAVDHLATPSLAQAVDGGQFVGDPGCHEHATREQGTAPGELNAETLAIAANVEDAARQDLAAVRTDLSPPDCPQLGRRRTFAPEVTVHVLGRRVARCAIVDHDHRTALTDELECAGEACGRAADDGDIAPADHRGTVSVVVRRVVSAHVSTVS